MLDIALLPDEYAVCRLPADAPLPAGLLSVPTGSEVLTVSRTADELSIICRSDLVPVDATVETPWRCLRVTGPLKLAMTGILASLVVPLADARVNIVAFSTYDTDYLLVPSVRLDEALTALTQFGHRVTT